MSIRLSYVRPMLIDSQGQPARQTPPVQHNRSQSALSQGNAPNTPQSQRQPQPNMQVNMGSMNPAMAMGMNMNMNMNMNANMGMGMNMMQQSPGTPQMVQNNNQIQMARQQQQQSQAQPQLQQQQQQQTSSPRSPQSAAREEERVTTLLEINAHLIQEVTNLQMQGKAGSSNQQISPTSPTTGDPNPVPNSPQDASRKPPSQEYADCMRRLQANLAYLAAIADSSKKASGSRPVGPAIMIPPSHLTSVHPLYHKLKTLFPEASQTTLNKAMAVANAQAARAAANPT